MNAGQAEFVRNRDVNSGLGPVMNARTRPAER